MHRRSTLRLGIFFLAVSTAGAQTLTIDHQPVGCAAAEQYPRVEARFAPPEAVAAARVVFQGQSPEWYSVTMKPEGAGFTGVLPKPKRSLKEFHYYIEVTGSALGTSRTPDYAVSIIESSGQCKGRLMAGSLASASVLIQGPAGVAALPAGFAPAGVVAGSASGSSAGAAGATAGGGGGGLSGAAVAGIAAGGAAVAGVAVAAGKGGDSTSSSTSSTSSPAPTPTPAAPSPTPTPNPPSPTPTPSPSVPCPACYAGQWRLDGTFTSIASPSICGNKSTDVGKVETIAVTFTSDGSIIFAPGEGRGVVDAQGNFKLDFDGDPPGSGRTCPAGGATGRCTTLNSCSGSGSQGGDTIAILIVRQ